MSVFECRSTNKWSWEISYFDDGWVLEEGLDERSPAKFFYIYCNYVGIN